MALHTQHLFLEYIQVLVKAGVEVADNGIFKQDRHCTYNVTLSRAVQLWLPWQCNECYTT